MQLNEVKLLIHCLRVTLHVHYGVKIVETSYYIKEVLISMKTNFLINIIIINKSIKLGRLLYM